MNTNPRWQDDFYLPVDWYDPLWEEDDDYWRYRRASVTAERAADEACRDGWYDDNGDRMEDVEDGKPMGDGGAQYLNDGERDDGQAYAGEMGDRHLRY